MRMEIDYNGKTYVGSTSSTSLDEEELTLEAENFGNRINTLESMYLKQRDGSYIIIHEDVIRKSVFRITP